MLREKSGGRNHFKIYPQKVYQACSIVPRAKTKGTHDGRGEIEGT